MLQFGLRAHDMGRLPAEELAEALASCRPSSIQLALAKAFPLSGPLQDSLNPGLARYLRDLFSRKGIAVSVLGCYINPVHPDPEVRDRQLRLFEEHLRFSRDLGNPLVGTETGSRMADCSYHPDTEKPETFDCLCRSLERLLKTAEKCAAVIGVEPVAWQHTLSTEEKTGVLLRRLDSPSLRIIWDPVNLIPPEGLSESQESFFREALELFGSRIDVVHIKDFRMDNGRKIGTLASGTGDLDYPLLFRLLQARKPGIDLLLENTGPENREEALAFVRRIARETAPEGDPFSSRT